MAEVLLLPYLPLRDRVTVGQWELIPRGDLSDADASSSQVAARARGLMDLYQLPGGNHAMGAFVRSADGNVGEAVDKPEVLALRKAVLVAMLDANPELTEPMETRRSDGHRTPTADHALLFGHNVSEDGYIGVDYGELVTRYVAGLNVDNPGEFAIPPPIELGGIVQGRPLNHEYAEAAYDILTTRNQQSRRIAAAIDVLDFIWRNSTSITATLAS